MMNGKGCGRKLSWPKIRYYPSICLDGLKKTMKKPQVRIDGLQVEICIATSEIRNKNANHSTTTFGFIYYTRLIINTMLSVYQSIKLSSFLLIEIARKGTHDQSYTRDSQRNGNTYYILFLICCSSSFLLFILFRL
jgi:hypothetical protein